MCQPRPPEKAPEKAAAAPDGINGYKGRRAKKAKIPAARSFARPGRGETMSRLKTGDQSLIRTPNCRLNPLRSILGSRTGSVSAGGTVGISNMSAVPSGSVIL